MTTPEQLIKEILSTPRESDKIKLIQQAKEDWEREACQKAVEYYLDNM